MNRATVRPGCLDRRQFMQTGLGASLAIISAGRRLTAGEEPTGSLAFVQQPPHFSFDTGRLRGRLRQDGLSRGLMPLVDLQSGAPIAQGYGILSHYRLLDAESRYRDGAWSWPSQARRRDDGAVEVDWALDDSCPFAMRAVYRWAEPHALDVVTTVTARRAVERLEVFLASYFEGFPVARVYVRNHPAGGDRPGFLEADRSRGVWQMFPRDEAAARTIQDGRWQRPPHPVDWRILQELAAPLAMRRDPARGLTALLMARPQDCFAVATPYGEESHRSLYLSLFGRDLQAEESATAQVRLVIRSHLSDEDAVACYRQFLADDRRQNRGESN
jgi:hypothetical protein